jgi:hypothetical protein
MKAASMSAFKKMPNEKPLSVLRRSVWIFIVVMVSALAYLKNTANRQLWRCLLILPSPL